MHLSCLNRHLSVTANSINCVLYIFEFDSVEFGEPLPGAEKKEVTTRQRPAGATSQEAEARSRMGSHCPGPKMKNQDRPEQPTKRPRSKAEDMEPLSEAEDEKSRPARGTS